MAYAQTDGGNALVTPRDGPPSPSASPNFTPSAGQDTPVTPSAAPGSVVTDPGNTPDFAASIQGDSGYLGAQSAATASAQNADAARRAAIRSAFVQYGGDMPAGFSDAYGDIDQATQDAAKANQYSTIANVHHNYEQSVEQFRKALAARGMVGSGDMNYGQQQLDRGLGQSEYDAGNVFGNQFTGALNGYAGVLDQNQGNLVNAIGTAEANQYANPANRITPRKTANRDTALSQQYGTDIYTDGTGAMYDRSGSVFTPPAPSASASPYATPYAPYAAPYAAGTRYAGGARGV